MNKLLKDLLEQVGRTADFGYVTFDSINATNAFGDNALHCVCVWGDLRAVKLLVENKISISQRGEHGVTPLKMASEFGHSNIVEYLISKGADPAEIDAEETFDPDVDARHMQALEAEIQSLTNKLEKDCGS